MEGLLALIIRDWILFSLITDKGNKIVFTNKIMSPNFHPKLLLLSNKIFPGTPTIRIC